MGPFDPLGRQQTGLGHQFFEIFGNGEGVPDTGPLVVQTGRQDAGRQQKQFGAVAGIVDGGAFDLHLKTRHLAEKPGPKGP